MERVTGIEPAWPAWKAGALPLSYTRIFERQSRSIARSKDIGEGKEKGISPLDSSLTPRGVA